MFKHTYILSIIIFFLIELKKKDKSFEKKMGNVETSFSMTLLCFFDNFVVKPLLTYCTFERMHKQSNGPRLF